MAAKKNGVDMADDMITIGPCSFPAAWLTQAQVQDYSQSAVILHNERQKTSVKIGDQIVGCSVQLYITREPVGNDEAGKVTDAKALGTANKKQKELDAANALAAEKRTMFDLGKQSSSDAIMGTFANLPALVRAADALKTLQSK